MKGLNSLSYAASDAAKELAQLEANVKRVSDIQKSNLTFNKANHNNIAHTIIANLTNDCSTLAATYQQQSTIKLEPTTPEVVNEVSENSEKAPTLTPTGQHNKSLKEELKQQFHKMMGTNPDPARLTS